MQYYEQILRKELNQRGFIRSGNRNFLFRVDDALLLITFERPSSALYAWFSLLPIFYPWPGYFHFSFGKRFYTIFPDVDCPTKDANKEETEAFFRSLLKHVDGDILPVLKSFSKAEVMCPFYVKTSEPNQLRQDPRYQYFGSRPENHLRIAIYGYLYLKQYDHALAAAEQLRQVSFAQFEQFQAKTLAECDQIIAMIHEEKHKEIENMIEKNLSDNLSLLEKKKPKKAQARQRVGKWDRER